MRCEIGIVSSSFKHFQDWRTFNDALTATLIDCGYICILITRYK